MEQKVKLLDQVRAVARVRYFSHRTASETTIQKAIGNAVK